MLDSTILQSTISLMIVLCYNLTASMNLSEEVDLEDYVSRPEKISGAEISCVVQEAGMQAVRNNRCARRTRRAHAARAQPRPGGSSEGV